MDDQELKDLWRSQKLEPASAVDPRDQIEAMRIKMAKFRRGLNGAYFIELALRAFIIIVFGVYFFVIPYPVTRIGALIVVAGELFVSWKLMQNRKRALCPDAGAPVAVWLKQEREWLHEWVHDVKPFRTAFWEDLLPLWPGVNVFMWGFPQVSLGAKVAFTVGYTLISAWGYWLNRSARPQKALPLENELDALLLQEPQGGTVEEHSSAAAAQGRNRSTGWMVLAFAIALLAIFAGAWNSFKPSRTGSSLRAPGFEEISAFNDEDIARVEAWLQEQIALAQYPSLSVAIVRDGRIVYRGAFGFENIKAGRKATPQTSYHVASVTKAFTASLAVMLHARGVVDLDQPVVKYLPKDVSLSRNPALGATITLRQLASHTSGLPRGVSGPVQSVEDRYELEPKRLYERLADVKLEFDPGTGDRYSNLGFGLLGHVLERAAGKPFDRLLREMLCDPLQLERTVTREHDKLRVATGYSSTSPRREEKHSYRERFASSGGLIATAEDLAKFLSSQMKPGLFSREMLEQLHTASRLSNGSPARTALGWSIGLSKTAGRILEKNGGRNNCSAWIGFAPEHGVAVAVVANCGGPDVDPIGHWLLDRSVPGGHKR